MPQDLMGDSAMQEQPGLPQQPKMQLPMSGSPVPSLAGMGGGLPNMGATGAKLPNFQPTAGAGAGQYMPGFGMRKPMAMAGAAPGAGAGGRPLASAMGLAVTGDMPMSGMQQDIG